MFDEFSQAAADILLPLDSHAFETLADFFSRMETLGEGESMAMVGNLSPDALREAASRLVAAWNRAHPTEGPCALAIVLRVVGATLARLRESSHEELVWTGPASATSLLRRIDQALVELVQSAQRELLIVSYAFTSTPLMSEAIDEAIERGVHVRLLFETHDESSGRFEGDPDKFLTPKMRASADVFVWPIEKRPKVMLHTGKSCMGVLHAKCALADDRVLLLSSANFTENAHRANIEMGILVTGGELPKQAYRHFEELIATGTFEKSRAREN